MKKISIFLILLHIRVLICPLQIYQNYVQAYGEGPLGQHIYGMEVKNFDRQQAADSAKSEIIEFLSAMIYGYKFKYKIANTSIKRKGYFDIIPIVQVKENDINLKLTQFQEKKDSLRFQVTYRLTSDQKSYIKGFQSSLAKMSTGEAYGSSIEPWETRIQIYYQALQNAVLNEAKKRYKSRPLILEGKLLLIENPLFAIIAGDWRVQVKVHVIIKNVEYDYLY